jgi:hypothetical protein
MPSDKSTDLSVTLDRILRERLEAFNVPQEIRGELRKEILAFFQRPERKPFGAVCMTPEASMAADQARKEGKTQQGGPTPKIS